MTSSDFWDIYKVTRDETIYPVKSDDEWDLFVLLNYLENWEKGLSRMAGR